MKATNLSRTSLENYINEKELGKQDIIVNLRHIRTDYIPQEDGNHEVFGYSLDIRSRPAISFFDWALTQILMMGKVPKDFYMRCPNSLRSDIFNHFLNINKDVLLRRLPDANNTETDRLYTIRGVLSAGYTTVDDDVVYPPIIESLAREGITEYRELEYDDMMTRVLVEFPNVNAEYQNTTFRAGLIISNSEVGHSAIHVEPVAFGGGFSFTNRHTLIKEGFNSKIIHRGEITQERLATLVTTAKEISQVGLVQLAESWTQRVSGLEAIAYVKSIPTIPKRILRIFEEQNQESRELEKSEVARQILNLARELPLFQRTNVEQSMGSFLGVFNSYKNRMRNIQRELSLQ